MDPVAPITSFYSLVTWEVLIPSYFSDEILNKNIDGHRYEERSRDSSNKEPTGQESGTQPSKSQ